MYLSTYPFGFREEWLCRAVAALGFVFSEAGYGLPPLRVSIGWTSRGRGHCVAECWPRAASSIGVNEIFVAPTEDNSVAILDHLTHELAHAIDDCQSGHGKSFRKIALDVGLQGRMSEARAGRELRLKLYSIAEAIGPIPHQKIYVPEIEG
ncbi:MAG: SprT-like domain-containing protein [Rhodocyclales bacterium]|nr:SprT-like domain-containing protein [Rhodocyclales bacterium]